MVTYQKHLAARGWHRSTRARVLLVILGLLVFYVGMAAWGLETEYGGDPNLPEYVIEMRNDTGEVLVAEGEEGAVVFEGTSLAEAEAWVERQRGARDYRVPALVMIVGAVVLLLGVTPSPVAPSAQRQVANSGEHLSGAG